MRASLLASAIASTLWCTASSWPPARGVSVALSVKRALFKGAHH